MLAPIQTNIALLDGCIQAFALVDKPPHFIRRGGLDEKKRNRFHRFLVVSTDSLYPKPKMLLIYFYQAHRTLIYFSRPTIPLAYDYSLRRG